MERKKIAAAAILTQWSWISVEFYSHYYKCQGFKSSNSFEVPKWMGVILLFKGTNSGTFLLLAIYCFFSDNLR